MRTCLLITVTLFAFTSSVVAQQSVYKNGRVFTANSAQPWAEAVITDGDKIVFVGTTDEANRRASKEADHHDLAGKFVMPGIIDTHTHPGLVSILSEDDTSVSLPQTSKQDLLDFLREYAKGETGPLVSLGEWNVEHFLPKGPHKSDLDAIFPDKPVILYDNSGHSTWLNSIALAMFGISKETPNLSDNISYFVRDENGDPTGWVKEFAIIPYVGNMILPAPEEMKTTLATFTNFLSKNGVTTLMDAGNLRWNDEVYSIVAELEKAGELNVRYEGSYHIYDPRQLDNAVSEVLVLRKKFGGKLLTFNTVKIHYDGVLEINTAGQLEPYANLPESRGGILVAKGLLTKFILELAENKIDLHMHCVGDRATQSALDATERARVSYGGPLPINVSLAHLEQVAQQDMNRFAKLDVSANFTPHWLGGYFKGADQAIGAEKDRLSQQAKSMVNAGARVTFSSDVTTFGEHRRAAPFFGLQIGVTRQNVSGGKNAPIFGLESERLSVSDMIVGYTRNAAHQMGRPDDVGAIEVGRLADFIVLDRDPFKVNPYELHKTTAVTVVLGGKMVSGN